MLDSWVNKTKLERFVNRLVEKRLKGRISANQLTLLGFTVGLLTAFTIFLSGLFDEYLIQFIVVSVILMWLSFVLDSFDGALARLESPTKFGGVLDMFCDRAVEVSIIIAIVSTDSSLLLWPGFITSCSIILCITMFLVVGGAISPDELNDKQKIVYYRKGLIERSETLFFLMFIVIFVLWREILLWIFALLVLITALLRLKDAYILFNRENALD